MVAGSQRSIVGKSGSSGAIAFLRRTQMAWRVASWMGMALAIAACSSNDSGSQGGNGGSAGSACPTAVPKHGAACSASTEDCSYLKQDCPCGDDLHIHCQCTAGSWNCGEDFDCYQCPCSTCDAGTSDADASSDGEADAAPDTATDANTSIESGSD